MAESTVQVQPDGTGKQIRTELVAGVHQQVTTLADSAGNLLDTQLNNLDLSLTALRDSITAAGAAAKTLADVVTAITGNLTVTQSNPQSLLATVVDDHDTTISTDQLDQTLTSILHKLEEIHLHMELHA